MTYYYYFVRGVKIERFITPMYGSWFVELTYEQREFYLANPNATVQEVVNCQLTSTYVPPTPDVQEYAADKVKELKNACYGSVSVTSLEFAMAIDKVVNITADSYYSLTDARRVVSDFRSQSKYAMQLYDTYKQQIESAQTIEDIDTIYEQAMVEL